MKLIAAALLAIGTLAGQIKSVDRQIAMGDSDVSLITADIKFTHEASDKQFLYTIAADFESTLVSIEVTDALRGESATLPIK